MIFIYTSILKYKCRVLNNMFPSYPIYSGFNGASTNFIFTSQ